MKRGLLFFGILGILCVPSIDTSAQTKAASSEKVSTEQQARIRKLIATLGPDPTRGTSMPNPDLPTNQAKEELIAIGKPATLPLCEVLNEKDLWRRIMAVEALTEIRDRRALKPLLRTLQRDSANTVRGKSRRGIGRNRRSGGGRRTDKHPEDSQQ
jgi:hypothetical protein